MNSLYNDTASRIEMLYDSSNLKELCYTSNGTELMQIYNDLTGENYCNVCPNTMYLILLDFKKSYKTLIEKKMAQVMKKYRFKDGQTFTFFGTGHVWSNDNLTDEIADMIIDAHPDNIKLFTTIEFEVKEIEKEFLAEEVKTEEVEEPTKTEEEPQTEAKAKAKK